MAAKTQGPVVYTALIMPLSSHATFPKPQPPGGGGGTTPPPSGGGEYPDHTLPGDLPHPEHPIFLPLPPGAPVDPDYGIPEGAHPDNTLPGAQPRPDHDLPPFPSHPIVLPPSEGGGWLPVYIDNTLPGDLPHPDQGLPGGQPGVPTHPIVLPPTEIPVPPEVGIEGTIKFKAIWTPTNGWQTIGVIIPSEEFNEADPDTVEQGGEEVIISMGRRMSCRPNERSGDNEAVYCERHVHE